LPFFDKAVAIHPHVQDPAGGLNLTLNTYVHFSWLHAL
jgi:hypothetical protein